MCVEGGVGEAIGSSLPSSASTSAGVFAKQNLAKGVPELGTEDGVNDGVEEAVDISQPQHEARDGGWDGDLVLNERPRQREYEEWKPADDESASNNSQGSRCLALSLLLQPLAVASRGQARFLCPIIAACVRFLKVCGQVICNTISVPASPAPSAVIVARRVRVVFPNSIFPIMPSAVITSVSFWRAAVTV